MNAIAVRIENLRKNFQVCKGGFFNRSYTEVAAVVGISLEIMEGQCVAFIGPNGAGKSTTIKILTGILRPSSGKVSVCGRVPWEQRTQLAYKIGAVFGQRSQLWYHLPALDTFELLARIYSLNDREYRRTRDALIERFDLAPILNIPVRKLSLGQRMRAEIAASLLHRPSVLFLDEPTIGLDVVARQELRELIREWNKADGVTVFLTSHDAGDIENVAERVVVINHGQVVLDDHISTVRRRFLRAKIVSAKFSATPAAVNIPGVRVLNSHGYSLTLEVDTTRTDIEAVTATILRAGPVADITIEDPPLEQVIAHIYTSGAPRSTIAVDDRVMAS